MYRSNKHKSRDQPSGEEQDATTILPSLQEHRERLARGKEAGGDANTAFDADRDVLASTFRRDASHACDKIFGLLGVLQSAPLQGLAAWIGRTEREVFTAVGHRILSSDTAGPRRFSLLHYVDTITRLDDEIPSWVPNFASRPCALPLDPRQRSGSYLFNASGSVPAACEAVPVAQEACPAPTATVAFRVRALVLDEVDGTVDGKTQHAAAVARRHLSSPEQLESVALAYCATLVAGSRRQGVAASSSSSSSSSMSTSPSYIQWSPPLASYRAWRTRVKAMADPDYDADMGMNPGSHVQLPRDFRPTRAHKTGDAGFEFHQRFFEACAGRLFFSTAQGRLGLGPARTVKGDLAVLVCGATTPFIMRKVEGNTKGSKVPTTTYRIIGEAYVHGVMNGEAFEDPGIGEKLCWLTLS